MSAEGGNPATPPRRKRGLKRREVYTHGYSTQSQQFLAGRSASEWAAFFIPYLRPGMSLLDCGCGPGTVTVGLAQTVTPGAVVGIDIEPSQIEAAQAHATEQGVANVRFDVASIYDLPFAAGSFQAAYAQACLLHLGDPVAALKEMRRVLEPGGVVGVRDADYGGAVFAPFDALVDQVNQLVIRLHKHNGGDPYVGRRHRELLREAGFTRNTATAWAGCNGTLEATRFWGQFLARRLLEPHYGGRMIELGWINQSTLEQMSAACRAWGQHPDAFSTWTMCEAVGWKG